MQVRPENQIKLSVVVPCFNEEKTLERCLQNVLEIQDESLSLEIIIVDDCSTDKRFDQRDNRYTPQLCCVKQKNDGCMPGDIEASI